MAEEELTFDLSLKKKKKSSKKSTTEDAETEAVTDLMADLATTKKKKSKSSSTSTETDSTSQPSNEASAEPSDDKSAVENPALFDAKKKKKKKKKAAAVSDFDAQLAEAGLEEDGAIPAKSEKKKSKSSTPSSAPTEDDGSFKPQVNEFGEPDLTYPELLNRFFEILADKHPELASDRSGHKFKIPLPEVKRDGKKSIFVNIQAIADKIHRPMEHIISFFYAELGTTGSVDGSNRLVIKGRFMPKQIETVLRKYIIEYVTCKTCKSINTMLRKENRLFFLDCNSCGSRRSVSSIKTGYQAVIKRQKPVS